MFSAAHELAARGAQTWALELGGAQTGYRTLTEKAANFNF